MSKTETPLVDIEDLGTALRVMTILPAPEPEESDRGLLSVWAWPLIGLGIALIAALIGLLLSKIGMGAGLAAIGVMAALAALTGCRHEAALLRAVTSLFGGQTPSKSDRSDEDETETAVTLEAQSAQTLAPAVMALTLVTLARWSAVTALVATGHALAPILAGAMLSRAAMPLIAVALPPATGRRGDAVGSARGSAKGSARGSAHGAPRGAFGARLADNLAPPRANAALALIVALTLSLFCLGWALIPAAAAAGVMAVAVALVGKLCIGGRNQDLIGAAQLITELGVLAALSAAF